ncbi:MAG: hypothetical protein ACRYFK_05435 [Janthinobacterium lividum]
MRENYFWLNETDFGIGEIQFRKNELEGKLTLEINASREITERISADEQAEFGWLLYPPQLYFRDVPISQTLGLKQFRVDEQLLDEYDVALYMLEHYNIVGIAELTATTFAFTGCAQLDDAEVRVVISCLLPS